ncbi:hypothetical protein GALL_459280 [mine drainage metagenome]|uniref:DUF3040 domain-containing protein n=1 Tax=mine drainage metagenome TaxID=410659 RepID=A0A1J5PXA5_9ZZZZ
MGVTGVGMPLSEYEQRVLEQMERQLSSDDPRLANTLTTRRNRGVSRYVLAGVGAVLGMSLLVVGVSRPAWWLGVLGFVVMFAAVTFAFAGPRRSGPRGVVENGKVRGVKPTGRSTSRNRSFMTRLEERWDRRREQGDR